MVDRISTIQHVKSKFSNISTKKLKRFQELENMNDELISTIKRQRAGKFHLSNSIKWCFIVLLFSELNFEFIKMDECCQ